MDHSETLTTLAAKIHDEDKHKKSTITHKKITTMSNTNPNNKTGMNSRVSCLL